MMSKIDLAIEKITAQQKGLDKRRNAFAFGEQLKEICKESEATAELVATDLDNAEMSIEKFAEIVKKKADEIHKAKKTNEVDISPLYVDELIRDFYGLPPKGEVPKIINLEDMM